MQNVFYPYHTDIFEAICMVVNHCNDCYNEHAYRTVCRPDMRLHPHAVNRNMFFLKQSDEKTNQTLTSIAEKHNYNAELVGNTWIQFQKK